MQRRVPLITGEIYHVFNKSIAHYVIFNSQEEYQRMFEALRYYKNGATAFKLSTYLELTAPQKEIFQKAFLNNKLHQEDLVEIIACCLMPTHFHLVLKQIKDNGITEFIGNVQNSYARFFNLRHNRKGPLWVGRFKNVLVKDDKQLLHLTRYIHLNPVTANLIPTPQSWNFSSFKEYIAPDETKDSLFSFKPYLDISPAEYEFFVVDGIAYQKELALIKHLLLEEV